MAQIGDRTDVAGKYFRAPSRLRRPYGLIILGVALVTRADVCLWRRSSCGSFQVGRVSAFARLGPDSSDLSFTRRVNRSFIEQKQTSSRSPPRPNTFFDKLSNLLPYSVPVFVTATADVSPSDSVPPSPAPTPVDSASIPVRLFQAISHLFTWKDDDHRNLAKESGSGSTRAERHQTDCSGGVPADGLSNTKEDCGLVHSGSFYGRMLQAVSDFIPQRMFDEDGDADEVGFLSRKRPKKALWAVPGIVSKTPETEAGIGDAAQEVKNPSTTPEVDAHVAAVKAASDGGFNIFPSITDYSLEGARDLHKRKPRRTPLWSLPAFPTSGGHLFHTSTPNEASVSGDTRTEEQKEGQQQQEPQQVPGGLADETDSKPTQQPLTPESFETSDFQQPINEAPLTQPSPADDPTKGRQVELDSEEATAITETPHPLGHGDFGSREKGPTNMETSLAHDVVTDNNSNNQDKANSLTSSSDNGSRSINSRRSISSTTRNKNSNNNSDKSNNRATEGRTRRIKSKSSSRGDPDSKTRGRKRRSGSGSSKPHRNLTTKTNKKSKHFEERKRPEESEPLSLLEQFTTEVDESYLDTGDSLSQFGSYSGVITPRVQLSNGSGKRSTGILNGVRIDDLANMDSRDVMNTNQVVTRTDKKNSGKSTHGAGDNGPMGNASRNMPTQAASSRISVKENSNTMKSREHQFVAQNEESKRGGSSAGSGPALAIGSNSFLSGLLSTPLQLLFKNSAGDTSAQVSSAGSSTQKKPRSSPDRSSRSRKRKEREPVMTLDTLREGGGLGTTFAQAVETSGAVIEVLSASRDLQEAIEALDLSAFGLPAVKPGGNSKKNGFEKLHSAAKAVEEVAHWSAAMDHAINTGKQFGESVSNTLQNLPHPEPSLSSILVSKPQPEQTNADTPFKGLSSIKERARGISLAARSNTGSLDSKIDMKQLLPTEDWKDAAMTALKEAAQKAVGFQKVLLGALERSENTSLNSRRGVRSDPLLQHALNVNDILVAIAGLGASERARSLQHGQQTEEHQEDEDDEEPQQHLEKGRETLLTHATSLRDKIESLFQVNAHQEGSSDGEYMMPLLRELYRAARHVFEVLDVSISVADESMDAMQLGKLLRMYEALVEEGKLAAVGFRSPRVPKRLGQPRVSCANKGMTCCVPAAAAGPDWKQKQQQQLFLQNSPQQECRAVFVSRSSMLCASTPYRNSPCNITHTKTAAMDKYSALLPVPAFSAAALCECEVSRQRNSDGLQKLDGTAEWTAGEIPADLIDKARKGWQYVKKLSTAGNSLVHLLDHTLGSPELNPTYRAPMREQTTSTRPQEQQQQQEEMAEKPFSGLADVLTKMLVNQQLLKLLKSDDPAAAVIPPISVSMHLPKKTKNLLLSKLQLPLSLAPPSSTDQLDEQ